MQRRSSARQSHLSALTQGQCWDYLAERCRGALERGGVPQRRRRPSARNEPFVPLLAGVRNATSRRLQRESARAQRVVTGVRDVSSKTLNTQYRDRAILELNTYTPNAPQLTTLLHVRRNGTTRAAHYFTDTVYDTETD